MERLFAGTERLDDGDVRIFACDERYAEPIAERVLPDGAVHLIFTLGDLQGGERNAELRCLAVGASCQSTRIVLAGAVDQVCVRIGVGSAEPILGVPTGEITDQGVALDALWGRPANEVLEQLAAAPTGTPRIAVMARMLRERMRAVDVARARGSARASSVVSAAATAREAVRRITRAAGRLRVAELAAQLGVGERRLQQIFHEHVGLSPKATARLARFRALIDRCQRAPVGSWSSVALEHGFYDQAHLINELREFTGFTPGELARRDDFGFFQASFESTGLGLPHADPS